MKPKPIFKVITKMKENKDILLKSWEIVQNIAKYNCEISWKIRMWGLSIWAALISYSFSEKNIYISILSIVVIIFIFIYESGQRIIEYKMIELSHDIENSLNKILTNSRVPYVPTNGIKTNISEYKFSDIRIIFSKNRWLIWLPYIILLITNLIQMVLIVYI